GFNTNSFPFKDKRIRKAILRAVNIPRFVHSSNRGKAIVAKGPLPPNFFDYKNIQQAQYNPDSAKKILKDLNFKPITVNFDFPQVALTQSNSIEFLKYQLGKIGIKLNIKSYNNWSDFNTAIKHESAQIFLNAVKSDILGDGLHFLYGLFYSTSEANTMHYNNPKVDHWIDEAFLEHDSDKRRILYQKIIGEILNDTPAVFLFHSVPNLAYHKSKINKLITNPYGRIQFNKIELR
ncbi:MAG: ABC transporter substrate-binding protein, partial [Calditrichaceae bacterium]